MKITANFNLLLSLMTLSGCRDAMKENRIWKKKTRNGSHLDSTSRKQDLRKVHLQAYQKYFM